MVTLRSCFPMLPHCLPAGNSGQQHLPDGSSLQCRHPLRHGTPGQQQLCHGTPASSIFPMALRRSAPASNNSVTAPLPVASSRWLFAAAPLPATTLSRRPRQQQLPDGAPLRRPCQQQTSSGGEEYSGLASNLAHLGRIC